MLFRNLKKDEKIVVSIPDNDDNQFQTFFRRVTSIVRQAKEAVRKKHLATVEKLEGYQNKLAMEQSHLQIDSIEDPVERGRARRKLYLAEKAASNEPKEKAYRQALSQAESSINADFHSFREEFIRSWEAREADANGKPLSSSGTPVEAHYVFNEKTVFINKPRGPLELRDFQKGEQ